MKLSAEDALKRGIEAHQAGRIQEADKYYTAILQAAPKHPDANHNMGVLAVGVGKVQEALPFLKTALEANPSVGQFWLSYIDALIKLNRPDEAKVILSQAKQKGAEGEGFDKIEQRLSQIVQGSVLSLPKVFLDEAMQLRESGKFDEAIILLKDELTRAPQDVSVLALLSHCYILNDDIEQAALYLDKAKSIDPKNASVGWNEVRLLQKKNCAEEALNTARSFNERFPEDVEGIGVLGSCLRASNDIEESLLYLNKAIDINPNVSDIYFG